MSFSISELYNISLNHTITKLKNKSSGDDIMSVKLLKKILPVVGYPFFSLLILWEKRYFPWCQFGFRNKHSYENACQLVLSRWKYEIVNVSVDLKGAFETFDR